MLVREQWILGFVGSDFISRLLLAEVLVTYYRYSRHGTWGNRFDFDMLVTHPPPFTTTTSYYYSITVHIQQQSIFISRSIHFKKIFLIIRTSCHKQIWTVASTQTHESEKIVDNYVHTTDWLVQHDELVSLKTGAFFPSHPAPSRGWRIVREEERKECTTASSRPMGGGRSFFKRSYFADGKS